MTGDPQKPAPQRRYPGRLYLFLGILAAVAGPVIYALQMQAKNLSAPWYFPILATAGALLIVLSLIQSRTIWRWGVAGLVTLFAGFVWLMMLVLLAAPPYTGPVTVGQAFPAFSTALASGEAFSEADLKSDQNTVLVFFRGRW